MSAVPPMEPIPFKLSVPGEDGLNFKAITSKNYKFRGFLRLDRDPYLVIADGRLFWIQDAYTTTHRFP